ncbi:hypothetical protein [Streptomyces sp. NPDC021622]|uniref:hypothetical protein n=1 Tax=Streptomyces sp. NPDC021622 TaxID=3155013 RepID=UPI0033C08DF5
MLETYRGAGDFEERFRATGYRDVGSPTRPAFMMDLCVTPDCGQPRGRWAFLRSIKSDGITASMEQEPAAAEWTASEEEFCGPISLLGVPDLAYSSGR